MVDASYRKGPSKPPVLSPKPNPSEIVKRLSFKRDGPETGDREESAGGESRVSSMIARLSNGSRHEEANTSSNDRKQFMSKFIKNDKENLPASKEPDRENSHNGIDERETGSKLTDDKDLVSKSEVEDVGHDIPDINIQTNGLAKVCHESSSNGLDRLR